jgi:integrase
MPRCDAGKSGRSATLSNPQRGFERVTEPVIMVPPARFQRATSRLGGKVALPHRLAQARKVLSYILASKTVPVLNSPSLALTRTDSQRLGLVERGSMPRTRTGAIYEDDWGRWWARVRYTDDLGRRREKRKLGLNKTDAKEKRDELLSEIKQHGVAVVGNDRMTFEDLAGYFEKHYLIPAEYRDGRKIAGVRETRNFKSMLKTLRAHFGKKRLRSLTYGDLRAYKLARLRSKSQRGGEMLKVGTVNRELSVLRRMLSIARQQRWLLRDVFKEGDPLIAAADEKSRERVLTPAEEVRLLAQCVGPREHLRGLLICGLDTGMRRGEILLMRWEDVDLEREMITVRAMHTKTLRERQVGITPRFKAELLRLYDKRFGGPNERVFGLTNNFKRSFRTACTDAKIVDLRFHDLRHTFATRLAEAGMVNDLIARLLGHSQSRMTYRYTNITEETARRAADILGRVGK